MTYYLVAFKIPLAVKNNKNKETQEKARDKMCIWTYLLFSSHLDN